MPTEAWKSPLTALICLNQESCLHTPGHTHASRRAPLINVWHPLQTMGTFRRRRQLKHTTPGVHVCVSCSSSTPQADLFHAMLAALERWGIPWFSTLRFVCVCGKQEKGDSTQSWCHKNTFVLHLCIAVTIAHTKEKVVHASQVCVELECSLVGWRLQGGDRSVCECVWVK